MFHHSSNMNGPMRILYQKVLQSFTPHDVVPPSYRLVYTHELVPYIYSIRSLVFLEIDLHQLRFFPPGALRHPSDSIPTWICAFHCCAAFSVCSAKCSSLWRWHLGFCTVRWPGSWGCQPPFSGFIMYIYIIYIIIYMYIYVYICIYMYIYVYIYIFIYLFIYLLYLFIPVCNWDIKCYKTF